MQGGGCGRLAGLAFGLGCGLALLLAACAHHGEVAAGDPEINKLPTDYRGDIVGAMHAYLADPTGIRDAGIADPALKTVNNLPRYVVCVRFNAKKRGNEYAGTKELAAVFIAGRFDRFVEKPQEQCAGAVFAPFPELQKMSR
jgi:hypothetical protein